MKKVVIVLFVVIISSFIFSIGIRPMQEEYSVRPGEVINHRITIDPERTDRNVILELYKLEQSSDGSFGFLMANEEIFPQQTWINFDSEVLVPAGQTTFSDIRINVPLSARPGTYNFMVMFTPEADQASGPVGIVMRYAVRITVNVEGISFNRVEVNEIGLSPDQNMRPTLIATAVNISTFDLNARIDAIIRDETGRMIERFELKSPHMIRNDRTSQRLTPNTKVLFLGTPEYITSPGNYRVNLFVNFDDRQNIYNYNLTIPEGVFNFASGEMLALMTNLTEIKSTLRPGGARTETIQIENRSDMDTIVQINSGEFRALSEDRNLNQWVTIRSQQQLSLPSRRTNRIVVSTNVPRDAEDGVYYGKILLNSFDTDGKFLTQKEIRMMVQIGENKKEVEMENILFTNYDEFGTFNLPIKNSGDLHIIPNAFLRILDTDRVPITNVDLEAVSEESWLMPGEITNLYGDSIVLEKGEYFYVIEIKDGNETLLRREGVLKVDEEEDEE